jgi:trimeric autotransporter adhesin
MVDACNNEYRTFILEEKRMPTMSGCTRWTLSLTALLTFAGSLAAIEPPERPAGKEYRHPDLTISESFQETSRLPAQAATGLNQRLTRLGVDAGSARVDRRSGRFETLILSVPLIPGNGASNRLQPVAGRAAGREQAAGDAFLGFVAANQADLGVDLREVAAPRVQASADGEVYHLSAQRTFDGIPVRGSYLSATINHGNMVLLGTHAWADRTPPAAGRRIGADEAVFAGESFLLPAKVTGQWAPAELVYVPMARGRNAATVAVGQGYQYRLAWSVKLRVEGDAGSWEALVDAHSGEVLASVDLNHYAEAKGGVYPVTNDGIVPDGAEQAGWPMPWLNVTTSGGTVVTDTGGNLTATGNLTASLTGQYVRIVDNCGASSLTQSGNLNFGTSAGIDCTTPGFGGAGNTHAGRTGFYELNRMKEMARSHLPSNTWLQGQLTSNMNINLTCNAFWSTAAGTVNFYRSGGGCSNTGEIAGVFDHEWGHGLDANDSVAGISSPSGEGVADIYAALRLNDSCIGRNFRTTVCTGFGDPCLTCTGVRDIDYLKRQSGQPHTFTWATANCAGSVHCLGAVYAEAVWSLWNRKLQAAPFNMDSNTAHELTARLTFLGATGVGTWFSGAPPFGGCGSTSGYLKYLAADDDNGNLNDGTPHMTAIYAAFNDQQIACATPAVQNSGCATAPAAAPSVTATPGDKSVTLSWATVSNATKYQVFRAEGIFACDFGKVKVGETTGLSFTDTNLQNGRNYSYVVIPIGAANTCFGPASSCTPAVPAGGGTPGCLVPADCNDGIACTADTCNAGICNNAPNNALCDNGLFCDGAETCSGSLGCVAGVPPCTGVACNEATNTCASCAGPGATCTANSQCCSGSCKGGRVKTCK